MALFGPRSDLVVRVALAAIVGSVVLLLWAAFTYNDSGYAWDVGLAKPQPIQFSHAHHVGGLGIDCRFCHESVTESASAGMPAVETCMGCHWQLYTEAPILAPLRDSWRTNRPIVWQRVYDLPDFVYFNHSIHVAKGVGCTTCHGQIDQMHLTAKAVTLSMEWCLDCHRNPERFLRPEQEVFNHQWSAPPDQEALGRKLINQYQIATFRMTDCSTCHR